VDDGSTDGSVSIANSYVLKDARFKIIKRPSNRIKGGSTCRNIGIENASGIYFQFLDSDDVISENKISDQMSLIGESSENVLSICKWGRFTNNIEDATIFDSLKSYNDFDNILYFLECLGVSKGYFPPHSYLIKGEIIKKAGMWNENLTINDDGEFMMRVISNADKIIFAKEAIAYYRYTESDNLSNYNDFQRVNDAILSWQLIDIYLKIRFKKESILYVELVKNALYLNVKKSFPELLAKHNDFFKEQLKEFHLWRRIKVKLKRIVQ
jgi:glycosyltransferase involved in cell wall biosynthesis